MPRPSHRRRTRTSRRPDRRITSFASAQIKTVKDTTSGTADE
jgi:hypothetical protein